ncbi:MAG: protein-export chaperone SecB [Oscillospiraceae bacterium]|nr:protein-export chaperone SecB [Oscillospiraceae bacterium]
MNSIPFQLIFNELSIRNNQMEEGEFTVSPRFSRYVWIDEGNRGFSRLRIEIKNTEEQPFPFDLTVDITGAFSMDSVPKEAYEEFLNNHAIRILLPYARTMVTNLTTAAMAAPIVLPLMDPVELFADKSGS